MFQASPACTMLVDAGGGDGVNNQLTATGLGPPALSLFPAKTCPARDGEDGEERV